ncbi:hypothetical protein GCM10023081_37890 [Arthrobacter ginkgonis]|uniref:HTH tetR-type domain-containing protein n=2 Tax=Arthrobacter ginkgonis TaxID=1630594 RepID=A0ABP7D0B7_9MICC
MREIARQAGFANGALKHFFDSKDDIIQATYQESLGAMTTFIDKGLDSKRGMEALRAIAHAAMPSDEERITAGRVLLSFWERAVNNARMRESYEEHLRHWRGALARYVAEGREDGDIRTATPDEQLVDELVLLTAGANVMVLVAPTLSTPELQKAHVESFLARIARED